MPLEIDKQVESRPIYLKVVPEAMALPLPRVKKMNTDPIAFVTLIRGRFQRIQDEFRPTFLKMPEHDIEQTDKLLDYTLAFSHANARYNTCFEPPEDFEKIVAEALDIRTAMLTDLESLRMHKILVIDPKAIPEITTSYENIISSLMDLCVLFETNWDKIQGKCPMGLAELKRAHGIASYIQETVGVRANGTRRVDEASDIRDRLFTLAFDSYEQARRSITYKRWFQKDYDDIVPSVYVNLSKTLSHKKDITEPHATDASPTVVAPATVVRTAVPGAPVLPREPGSDPFDT